MQGCDMPGPNITSTPPMLRDDLGLPKRIQDILKKKPDENTSCHRISLITGKPMERNASARGLATCIDIEERDETIEHHLGTYHKRHFIISSPLAKISKSTTHEMHADEYAACRNAWIHLIKTGTPEEASISMAIVDDISTHMPISIERQVDPAVTKAWVMRMASAIDAIPHCYIHNIRGADGSSRLIDHMSRNPENREKLDPRDPCFESAFPNPLDRIIKQVNQVPVPWMDAYFNNRNKVPPNTPYAYPYPKDPWMDLLRSWEDQDIGLRVSIFKTSLQSQYAHGSMWTNIYTMPDYTPIQLNVFCQVIVANHPEILHQTYTHDAERWNRRMVHDVYASYYATGHDKTCVSTMWAERPGMARMMASFTTQARNEKKTSIHEIDRCRFMHTSHLMGYISTAQYLEEVRDIIAYGKGDGLNFIKHEIIPAEHRNTFDVIRAHPNSKRYLKYRQGSVESLASAMDPMYRKIIMQSICEYVQNNPPKKSNTEHVLKWAEVMQALDVPW
jgi:hypothetical protein